MVADLQRLDVSKIICGKKFCENVFVRDHVYHKHDAIVALNKGPYWKFGLLSRSRAMGILSDEAKGKIFCESCV